MMNVARLLWLLLLSATSAFASTLSGTVSDSEGAVIAGAHVVIHWDASGSNYLKDDIGVQRDIMLTRDGYGNFSVDIPAGFYDLSALQPSLLAVKSCGSRGSKAIVQSALKA